MTEEFNITEWDGSVDRVKLSEVWNSKSMSYDILIEYPDGTVHQVVPEYLEKLKPRQIHV